jgi:GNAT superfamily N-acetyltransferase
LLDLSISANHGLAIHEPCQSRPHSINEARGYLGLMEGYELRPVVADEEELPLMAALLQTTFPSSDHFTVDVLRWQYKGNPEGAAVGFNAWSGTELAGHYVTLPMTAQVNGIMEKGLLSLNTATHPAHQGKGLFTKLAKATYEAAANAGYGFVVGVANANSTHGFTKKLGFELVSPLRAMIGMGALPAQNSAVHVQFAHEWNAQRLAWRLSHPAFTYSVQKVRGTMLVLSQRKQFGARYVLGVRDQLPEGPWMHRSGMALRKVWIGLDPAMDWRVKAYLNIPMRFRPSPLNLIFKDLTGQGRKLDAARVRFDALDFDVL